MTGKKIEGMSLDRGWLDEVVGPKFSCSNGCDPWGQADIRADERRKIVNWLRIQVQEGLDSPHPESAVQILADRIENNKIN